MKRRQRWALGAGIVCLALSYNVWAHMHDGPAPRAPNADAAVHFKNAAAKRRFYAWFFATHPHATQHTSTTHKPVVQRSNGKPLRNIPYSYTGDYVGAPTHTQYVPDTSGAVPSHSIPRDFNGSIRKYHVHVDPHDPTIMQKTFNTSGGFQRYAAPGHGPD